MPKVSIVMAVYNGAEYVSQTIESLLNQTFTDFEFIIIDDGSMDRTPQIVKSFADSRIYLISQDNRGLSPSLNRGIRISSGEYIARIDAGDIAEKERLKYQVQFLDDNSDYVLIGGFMEFITADGQLIYLQELPTSWEEAKKTLDSGGNPFLHPAVVYRREAAIQCGMYNEDLIYSEDREFYKRLISKGKMGNLPICIGKYRITPRAISNQDRKTLKKWSELVKKAANSRLTEEEKRFLRDCVVEKKVKKDQCLYALRVGKAFMWKADNARSASRYFLQAAKLDPFNWQIWFNLGLSQFPSKARRAINKFVWKITAKPRF